jgi:hypothetical protein
MLKGLLAWPSCLRLSTTRGGRNTNSSEVYWNFILANSGICGTFYSV